MKNGVECQDNMTTREGSFWASVKDNDYQMKSCSVVEIFPPMTSGRNVEKHSARDYLSYDFKNLSRRRISIPLTWSKTLSLVKKPVAP